MEASQQPQRSLLTSNLNSVASIIHISMLFCPLQCSIWPICPEEEEAEERPNWPAGFAAGEIRHILRICGQGGEAQKSENFAEVLNGSPYQNWLMGILRYPTDLELFEIWQPRHASFGTLEISSQFYLYKIRGLWTNTTRTPSISFQRSFTFKQCLLWVKFSCDCYPWAMSIQFQRLFLSFESMNMGLDFILRISICLFRVIQPKWTFLDHTYLLHTCTNLKTI